MGINFDTPIAVAMILTWKMKHVSYITSAVVTKHLQAAANATHVIKASKSLDRVFTYSIRVGAYVLMDDADEKAHHTNKIYVRSLIHLWTTSAISPD